MDSLKPIEQAAMFMLKTRGKEAALAMLRQALASVEQDKASGELSSAGYQRSHGELLAIFQRVNSAGKPSPSGGKASKTSTPSPSPTGAPSPPTPRKKSAP